ncbi:hypothetical protein TNIN_476871 [Trichonephila inaurata madagascariensis]|uniref:Uncharacterized protein n=1 Tax=Trichonephila inaurata madagascariensis TaxID=2747483 RepID=A0A8X6YLR3_9ARAC|nr:hypothetical protein TNIN_476871 [Trichonephila inaurata madagascariensis]
MCEYSSNNQTIINFPNHCVEGIVNKYRKSILFIAHPAVTTEDLPTSGIYGSTWVFVKRYATQWEYAYVLKLLSLHQSSRRPLDIIRSVMVMVSGSIQWPAVSLNLSRLKLICCAHAKSVENLLTSISIAARKIRNM